MTYQDIEQNWLSLRYWLIRVVLPSALFCLLCMAYLKFRTDSDQFRDHAAVIIGFFTAYFILVRGGHLVMIRSMHFDLKKRYGDKYAKRLAQLPKNGRNQNIGFALARIKRELSDAAKPKHKSK